MVALTVNSLAYKGDTVPDSRFRATINTSVVTTAPPVLFSASSLIIPMDTGANGQDNGMLRAYGLVYALLLNNIPVHWVINPSKASNGNDFTIASGSLQNVRTSGTISIPRSYAGGPFVIAASDAATALPIILSWQAVAGDNTMVHRLTSGSFMAESARLLIRAPRIAILMDGNEQIAFNNLNAAGITDATGASWSSTSPDILSEAAIQGPSTVDDADGALFHTPAGLTRYGYLASMHYSATASTSEVVQETRSWLTSGVFTHSFMQCEAARVFENDPSGLFLTTSGLADDGTAPTTSTIRAPSDPLAQIVDSFQADSGSVDSIGLAGGSAFRPTVSTLINNTASTLIQRIVMLSGNVDGDANKGKVTYLGGHDYTLGLPISSNAQTNGVRLFLNSIFESGIATDAGQSDVTITKSAPAYTNTNTIAYTINYSNPGPRPVENVIVVDTLPVGATYVGGSGSPVPTTNSGSALTWDLPPLASGAGGSITFSVTVTTDGSYTNRSRVQFSNLAVRIVSSNAAVTTRDTVAPVVDIPGPPTNPSVTNDTTPTLMFSVTGGPAATLCRFDSDSFVPCTAPLFTATSSLADGPHIFEVRATDAANNVGTDTFVFTVDTTPEISGTVTYGNAAAPPKYISNVAVTGSGSPNVFTTTDAPGATAGQYQLSGFGAGSYTVSLSKSTGQNSITSNDAARVAQHVTGSNVFANDNQRVTADVTGNNAISSQDAAKIAQFAAGLPPSLPNFTNGWRFFVTPGPTFPVGSSPTTRTYSSVTSNLAGEDYIGLLIGEVTGNWTPTAARTVGSRRLAEGSESTEPPRQPKRLPPLLDQGGEPEDSGQLAVAVGSQTTADKEIVVPVNVQGIADKDVISYEFDLRYDPSVIQPVVDVADLKETISRGLSVVTNATEPGLLRVVVYGAFPIDGDGVLLNLRFTAVGAPGSVSPLTFERLMFNEGEPRVTTSEGEIKLF